MIDKDKVNLVGSFLNDVADGKFKIWFTNWDFYEGDLKGNFM